MRRINQLIFAMAMLIVASVAKATVYDITAVLNGTDGGFSFSGFHYAGEGGSGIDGDGNPQTGSELMAIPMASGSFGSYNDNTGAFNTTLATDFITVIPTFTLNGNLMFDSSGFLSPASAMSITFHTVFGDISTAMDFAAGQVCCTGLNSPNSFNGGLLTLWGVNNTPELATYFPDFADPLFGLDLRLELTAVPVPAAVWLFGSGLLGLAGMARRRA